MSSGKYVRLTQGLYAGKMVPIEEWDQHIKNYDQDWYRSIVTYSADQVELYKNQKHLLKPGAKAEGSVAGITGTKSNCLVLDFDSEDNVEQARKDACEVLDLLTGWCDPSNINISFSGYKGFAVELFLDQEYTQKQLRILAENLAGKYDSWDTSLYDDNQLIRVVGTRHPKTGLYKTTLTKEELGTLTIEQIKEKAKTGAVDWTEYPNSLPEELFKSKKPERKAIEFDGELDFSTNTLGMPNWKFAILHGFFPPGKRHDCMLALASYFKGAGFPIEVTKNMVFEASRLQYERNSDHYASDPTDEGELTRTIEHIYGPTWTGGTFAYETNEKLKKSIMELFPEDTFDVPDDDRETKIKTAGEMLQGFKKFAKNIDQNRVYTGIPELDKNIMLTTGMMTAILGAPGSAKTSIALNIMSNTSKMGIHSMFFSLDMSENLIGAKLVTRETPMGFRQLTEKYKADEDLSAVEASVEESFQNVAFYSKSATTIKEMRIQIRKHEKNTGIKVKLVVVDYLELIAGESQDPLVNSSRHAIELKDLATDLDVCLIILVQPQKNAGDASFPLTSMRQVKGASLLEQNFRAILGIYREGFSPDTPELDKFLTIKGLKSTFESLFSVDVGWDGKTGKVYTLNEDGHRQLKRIREAKQLEKEAKKSSTWDDA